MRNQAAGLAFQIVDHVLVSNVEHCALGNNGFPVGHEFGVTAVVAAQFRKVIAVMVTGCE